MNTINISNLSFNGTLMVDRAMKFSAKDSIEIGDDYENYTEKEFANITKKIKQAM